ncbi:hypothetical protein HD806DRAFT_529114 [Xylariaceae sp. AK1471]|nr:hypothetical protein HD806DRAFT_529114 [Xylariaceae sp. AK1471]
MKSLILIATSLLVAAAQLEAVERRNPSKPLSAAKCKLRLTGYKLHGRCAIIPPPSDGRFPYVSSVVDLDKCFTNEGGFMSPKVNGGFSSTCSPCNLDLDNVLHCRCDVGQGAMHDSNLVDNKRENDIPLDDITVLQLDHELAILRCGNHSGILDIPNNDLKKEPASQVTANPKTLGGTATSRDAPVTQETKATQATKNDGYFIT